MRVRIVMAGALLAALAGGFEPAGAQGTTKPEAGPATAAEAESTWTVLDSRSFWRVFAMRGVQVIAEDLLKEAGLTTKPTHTGAADTYAIPPATAGQPLPLKCSERTPLDLFEKIPPPPVEFPISFDEPGDRESRLR